MTKMTKNDQKISKITINDLKLVMNFRNLIKLLLLFFAKLTLNIEQSMRQTWANLIVVDVIGRTQLTTFANGHRWKFAVCIEITLHVTWNCVKLCKAESSVSNSIYVSDFTWVGPLRRIRHLLTLPLLHLFIAL